MDDKLILSIEIDDMGTEGWRESVEEWVQSGDTFDEALLDSVSEMMRYGVHVVFCGKPGEKSMRDDFEVYVKPGKIISATFRTDP